MHALMRIHFQFFLEKCLGVYKPRVRCYETSELCMKFERCLDSESKCKFFDFLLYEKNVCICIAKEVQIILIVVLIH